MKSNMTRCLPGRAEGGFTLVEVMAVVTIIAILTLVAYPAYQSFIVKSNRAEAQSYLMDLAQMQQQYFNDARIYADTAATLNAIAPDRVTANYLVAIQITSILPPPTFEISATPLSGSLQEGDGVLIINSTGDKLRGIEPW